MTKPNEVPEKWGYEFCPRCGVELRPPRPDHANYIECTQALKRKYDALKDEFVKAWLWRQETFNRLEWFKKLARGMGAYKRLLKQDTLNAGLDVQLKKTADIARAWDEMDEAMDALFPDGYPEGW